MGHATSQTMFWPTQYATLQPSALFVSLVLVLTAYLWPRLGRLGYALLFAWAAWVNWHTAVRTPEAYVHYADTAVFRPYAEFMRDVLAAHVLGIVLAIAAGQALIAAGLLVGDLPARIALVVATIFFVAIAPLGVSAGFPASLVMAVGTLRLLAARDAFGGLPWSSVVRRGSHPRHA